MKTAVITGATRGIGRAIAEQFLSHGFQIATCARSDFYLYKVKRYWQENFEDPEILALPVDLRDPLAVRDFGIKINEKFPDGIDVLVNNAGLFIQGDFLNEPDGRLEEMLNLHLMSAYHLTRLMVPGMIKNHRGHIFNMCSVAATRAYPNGFSYGIAKFALRGFTENLRYNLKDQGIKVTGITPGAVWTDSWTDSGFEENRMIDVKDIAEMVWAAYNLSERANVDNILLRPQLGDL